MALEVSATPQAQRRITPFPTAVFASGNGTNLQAVIDAVRDGQLALSLRLVLCNRSQAHALDRARIAGIPTELALYDRNAEQRSGYALRLAELTRRSGALLVLLLGWMHVLAQEFLDAGFDGVLNLHPAYLPEDPSADTVTFPDGTQTPAFRGAHALRDAMAAGVPWTGASLIEITHQVDRGPLVARRPMRLHPGEGEATALQRLHEVERGVVREGVERWLAQREGKR